MTEDIINQAYFSIKSINCSTKIHYNSLPSGTFPVSAYKTAYELMDVTGPDTDNERVIIGTEGVESNIRIVMTQDERALITIKGRVEDEGGDPIEFATVIISDQFLSTRTDSFGYYTLKVN